jgi:phosphoribosylformylglycinamidine cyclo-ligase
MYRTFNCGLGMTICVPAADADRALGILRGCGETAAVIGAIRAGDREVVIVE